MSQDISQLRATIDVIDDDIITLLNKRSEIVKNVGMTKKRRQKEGMCFIRSGREAEVIRRIHTKFKDGVFPALPALHIWRMIICASLSLESDLTIAVNPSPDNNLYWLAREYFGAFTPVIQFKNTTEVIAQMQIGKAEVGVFTTALAERDERWWLQLPKDIKIFACLPFMLPGNTSINALAVARLIPEPTGNDVTMLKIIASHAVNRENLQDYFSVPITILDHCNVNKTHSAFLISINGFLEHIPPINTLEITLLGQYAAPLTLS